MNRLLFAAALLLAASPAAAQQPAADSARVYELAEVETPPAPVNVTDLRLALDAGFPPAKFAAGAGATVVISIIVAADGSVRQPTVVESTDSAFDAPTLRAITVLRLTPATVGGAPVATRLTIPIEWQAPAPVARRDTAGEGAVTSARDENGERVYTLSEVVARTYEIADLEEAPRPRNNDELRHAMVRFYPPDLRAARRGGRVVVRFLLHEDGTAEQFSIKRSTESGLDLPSIRAVSSVRFHPGKVNGQPVKVWVELPLDWRVP